MKFSSKFALVAAASLLSVSAFAITELPSTTAADLMDLAENELANPGASTEDGAVALISQTGDKQLAMITQEGSNNFAVIVQAQEAAIAAIVQTGGNNIAFISQQ
jgi:hypothetical protein